ncbi:MAG: DUF192 domain-containing protein [Clostridia bacterium]|nr:DUF192 domain-containing protein [Clostridia bacterium]
MGTDNGMRIARIRKNGILIADQVSIADSFFKRLTGLLKHQSLAGEAGILLSPCKQVHTIGMKFSIDVIFLSVNDQIVHIEHSMPPGKFSKYVRSADRVLEVKAGLVLKQELKPGDHLHIEILESIGGERAVNQQIKQKETLKLSELRENLSEEEKPGFRKRILGYNPKEVAEHIKAMDERLHLAELSFQNELEEHKTKNAMLTLERDDYHKQFDNATTALSDLQEKLQEFEEYSLSQADLRAYEEKLKENSALKTKLAAYEESEQEDLILTQKLAQSEKQCADYQAEKTLLTDSNHQLTMMVKQLQEESESRDEAVNRADYERIQTEYELIVEQYEEVLTEKNGLLALKNMLQEQNNRISASLEKMYKKNRELWGANAQLKLKMQKLISAFKINTYETKQHLRNIEQIRENMKNIFEQLDYEKADFAERMNSPLRELEMELDSEENILIGTRERESARKLIG